MKQFADNLSDRQAAEAVRARIDGKYALGLELTDEGFQYSVPSRGSDALGARRHGTSAVDRLLERCQERGWLKARGRQRTDSTHVLGVVNALNQLELVGEPPVACTQCPGERRPRVAQAAGPAGAV